MDEINQKTGVFLLFEGLPKTVIESQVLVNAQAISGKFNIEIWAFTTDSQMYSNSKSRLYELENYGVKIRIFRGIRPAIPLSAFFNGFLVLLFLFLSPNISFIHARSEYSVVCTLLAQLILGIPVIWDCRGDVFSEYTFRNGTQSFFQKILVFMKYLNVKTQLFLAKKFSVHSIFVSKSLKDRCAGSLSFGKYSIIPCTASDQLFYFSKELRQKSRKELGLNENEIAIIYCGSASAWQCINESVKIIKTSLSKPNVRGIILSPDCAKIKNLFSESERSRIIWGTVKLEEVNYYLNAADFSLFIRKDHPLNLVASPVKFAEYCLAGLPIIMTNAVQQSREYASELGNLIPYVFQEEFLLPAPFNCEKRDEIAKAAIKKLSRNAFSASYENIYEEFG